ncbi:hypothetical protein GOODEAATRI_024260 [Goodea atripinnis]|uniref:Uncharacterized protein n=1 Tax=Goodea atripinnis TaxID=208336 RepID=A0ABV0NX93_9TELE
MSVILFFRRQRHLPLGLPKVFSTTTRAQLNVCLKSCCSAASVTKWIRQPVLQKISRIPKDVKPNASSTNFLLFSRKKASLADQLPQRRQPQNPGIMQTPW